MAKFSILTNCLGIARLVNDRCKLRRRKPKSDNADKDVNMKMTRSTPSRPRANSVTGTSSTKIDVDEDYMDVDAIVKDEKIEARNLYPEEFCQTVREGLAQQVREDDKEVQALMQVSSEGEIFYDDITYEELPRELVLAARRLEIEYFRKMKVYTKVHRREAYGVTGKPPIKVRWVDVNKGSKEVPEIRSRLVAKEIKVNDRSDLFAGTPPLEALKLLLSMAASSGEEDVCISVSCAMTCPGRTSTRLRYVQCTSTS